MKENADKARGLDAAEIAKQLRDASEQIFRLRFQLSMGQADGLTKLRKVRRGRARMLTVQRERELGQAEAPVANPVTVPVKKNPVKTVAVKKTDPKAAVKKPVVKKA